MGEPTVLCPNCGWSPVRAGCTPTRCNADAGSPWRYDDAGRLVDRHGDVVDQAEPYFRVVAALLPELDQLVHALAAAGTVGEVRRLRPWADALARRLDEARVVRPATAAPAATSDAS